MASIRLILSTRNGADALRFTLTKMATETQDARMPVKRDASGKKHVGEIR